jgi:hypothetical protein
MGSVQGLVKKEGEKRKNKYFLKVRVTKTGS